MIKKGQLRRWLPGSLECPGDVFLVVSSFNYQPSYSQITGHYQQPYRVWKVIESGQLLDFRHKYLSLASEVIG
jgi:hypothetical protein